MARMTVSVDDDTRGMLIRLAGGERKIGGYLDELVAAECTRQNVTLEALAERVGEIEESWRELPDLQALEALDDKAYEVEERVGELPNLQALGEQLEALQPKLDEFNESWRELPDLQALREQLEALQELADNLSE